MNIQNDFYVINVLLLSYFMQHPDLIWKSNERMQETLNSLVVYEDTAMCGAAKTFYYNRQTKKYQLEKPE